MSFITEDDDDLPTDWKIRSLLGRLLGFYCQGWIPDNGKFDMLVVYDPFELYRSDFIKVQPRRIFLNFSQRRSLTENSFIFKVSLQIFLKEIFGVEKIELEICRFVIQVIKRTDGQKKKKDEA